MSESRSSLKTADYIESVGRLLSDLDEEDRTSLLQELSDQIEDMTDAEVARRLGTPEEFVAEYRRSAGLSEPAGHREPWTITTVASALLLPVGLYALYTFGDSRLILMPLALATFWLLARISRRPLRIAWSVLAGTAGAQVLYFIFDQQGGAGRTNGLQAAAALVAIAALVALLFYRTSRQDLNDTNPTSA